MIGNTGIFPIIWWVKLQNRTTIVDFLLNRTNDVVLQLWQIFLSVIDTHKFVDANAFVCDSWNIGGL